MHCNQLVVRGGGGFAGFMTIMFYNLHIYYSVGVKCYLIKKASLNK